MTNIFRHRTAIFRSKEHNQKKVNLDTHHLQWNYYNVKILKYIKLN